MDFVAVKEQPKLDAQKLRADFPIFEQEVRGKALAYLDSAVSSHKPRQVLDKLRTFYETSYANVHGELRLEALEDIAAVGNVKVVANNLVSNALGTINPVERLAAWAHERGAIMVVDAAQAAPHHAIDVQQLGCDFLAFSSHKMCGPTSVGALWGRADLLEAMAPFNLGRHMIRSVKLEETTWGQIPFKFEAG